MMILSLSLQAIISATYLVVANPFLFILVRSGEGAVAAVFLPSSRAIITDAIPTEKRGEAFGIYSAFFNAGFLPGPALGGIIASTGYATAFIGAVIFRLVAIVIVIVFALHGIAYSLMQPAIDAHLASVSRPDARARTQGLYTAFGTFGGFVGASVSSLLYAVNYRLPLLTIAGVFGVGILIGGLMIRRYEARDGTGQEVEVVARETAVQG